ncbi:response regulator [Amnibacterium endophyticum]|uniref:Response regulator n=1 Tax=Amnibacterium endophyticum TaxID=2109337 RepID=A0ABW4L8R9_9MICO
MTAALRVVVADDHVPFRDRVRDALVDAGIDVVGEAGDAGDAHALTIASAPDAVLLDVHMPGGGIRAARRIAAEAPDVAVVMLTQSDDDDDLFDSIRAGAAGYVLKNVDPAALPGALRRAIAGEAAMTPRLVARVLDEFRNPRQRLFARGSAAAARLSAREWDVMTMLADGRSTDEVAAALFLSPTTVRVHVSSVLKKLQVKDRESAFALLRQAPARRAG